MDHEESTTPSSEASVTDTPVAASVTSASSAPSLSPERIAAPSDAKERQEDADARKPSPLADLFTENAAAKIWRVAESFLKQDPTLQTYPEYILPRGGTAGTYMAKPAAFWTCGFFPASLYCVLERVVRHPQSVPGRPVGISAADFHDQLLQLCRRWSAPLHAQATRTNTHDLGFMVRALRMDWELTGDAASLRGYVTAAESLARRFDARVGAVRSWDRAVSYKYEITDMAKNFLIIVDSMCNMDLLFYAAKQTNNPALAAIATSHAHAVLRTLVRPDGSTWHVANLDPNPTEHKKESKSDSRGVQYNMTHQGYSDDSTWSRGQAWGILGFAQTYNWTGDAAFLRATRRLADYFLKRLDESPAPSHTYVPLWDFDAPTAAAPTEGEKTTDRTQVDSEGQPLRDTSAGLIAANGLLLLHQALVGRRCGAADEDGDGEGNDGDGNDAAYAGKYLRAALRIARDTLGYSLDREDAARFVLDDAGSVHVPPGSWDAILRHSTANNNRHALLRYADVGLVYADYYFLELGNQLLRMGLVSV